MSVYAYTLHCAATCLVVYVQASPLQAPKFGLSRGGPGGEKNWVTASRGGIGGSRPSSPNFYLIEILD